MFSRSVSRIRFYLLSRCSVSFSLYDTAGSRRVYTLTMSVVLVAGAGTAASSGPGAQRNAGRLVVELLAAAGDVDVVCPPRDSGLQKLFLGTKKYVLW